MSKYIKVFDTVEDYNAYSGSTGFVSPNVSYIVSGDATKYDDNEIKHYTKDTWLFGGENYNASKSIYAKNIFDFRWGIKSIDIPLKDSENNTLTEFSTGCFENCFSLEKVTMQSGITSIGQNCFNNCVSLANITLSNSVTFIGKYAFKGCSSLTNITIPSGLTGINESCFENCKSLTSIDLPSGLTTIGNSAFKNCSGLTTVNIPDSVTSLNHYAFNNCKGLTTVTIPSGVTSIGVYAFNGCTGLTSVTINATTPPTLSDTSVFNNTNNCPIYVPSESVDTYKSTTNWSSYASRIQAIPTD